ncbi:MAG: threonylcarbamoyl-AMP synthase [Granulosicoccus sp.]|nr:threonylcarbamoyl-AMP synthase [Granulosicoccus sp.]
MSLSISLDQAVQAVRRKETIAYPTESVFGLGCDPLCPEAVQAVINIKGRSADKGLILIAANQSQLHGYMAPVQSNWKQQFDRYWPGPVTFVVPVSPELDTTVAELLTGGRDNIAVRVSNHPVVKALCQRCNSALVSTSANRSGGEPLRSAQAVRQEFADDISAIVDAEVGTQTRPSTIIDIVSEQILR